MLKEAKKYIKEAAKLIISTRKVLCKTGIGSFLDYCIRQNTLLGFHTH